MMLEREEAGDVAGTGEEDFEAGMRQNAMERDAADANNDGKLDFAEFCGFVREREEGNFTDEELRQRFDALDMDRSGMVDMAEYLTWSLREALSRSSSRVVDLFRAWDEDKSGTVDKGEFFKAVRALGFDVTQPETDAVFDTIDVDDSGTVEYKELHETLRTGVGSEGTKNRLKRMQGRRADRGRGAKITAKNINANYVTARTATLPPTLGGRRELGAAAAPSDSEAPPGAPDRSVPRVGRRWQWRPRQKGAARGGGCPRVRGTDLRHRRNF
jgi:Ca2+-binding EF-hand superfamily protein